ncbi:MAG: hypothetical protein ACI87E_003897 [Mariniblastus sp.]
MSGRFRKTLAIMSEYQDSKISWIAGTYFLLQAGLGAVWWAVILNSRSIAELFFLSSTVAADLTTFAIADLIGFVLLSAIAAILVFRNSSVVVPVVFALVGTVGYALLCCLGLAMQGGPFLSIVAMLPAWLATGGFAVLIYRKQKRACEFAKGNQSS